MGDLRWKQPSMEDDLQWKTNAWTVTKPTTVTISKMVNISNTVTLLRMVIFLRAVTTQLITHELGNSCSGTILVNIYIPTASRVLIEHDDIQIMTLNLNSFLMNCIKTKIYAGHNLSIKFRSMMKTGIHPVKTQKDGKD